ncbi:hypothetical protein OIU77_015110, partial [Salix suchowensis]
MYDGEYLIAMTIRKSTCISKTSIKIMITILAYSLGNTFVNFT